jgi:peptidoglycan/xylan/chitin deacetylase (PgdA/CDA1 family)
MKRQFLRVATSPVWLPLWRRLRRRHGAILTWHRFTDLPVHPDRYPVSALKRHLAMLRRDRFEIISLPEMIRRLNDSTTDLSRTVALTVDDGYHDFADLAAEVFLAYDCPVTTFLTTGFLDGMNWMWWDRVDYSLTHATQKPSAFVVDGEAIPLELGDTARGATALRLWTALKRLSTEERVRLEGELARLLGVNIPQAAPAGYHAMSWDQVRSLSRRGLRFAPHTVTHPVLTRSTPMASEFEIDESWRRLQQEEPSAERVFAYPNGLANDFNAAHAAQLDRLGFDGAVTMAQHYAPAGASHQRFQVPRFSASADTIVLRQVVSGLEAAVRRIRSPKE